MLHMYFALQGSKDELEVFMRKLTIRLGKPPLKWKECIMEILREESGRDSFFNITYQNNLSKLFYHDVDVLIQRDYDNFENNKLITIENPTNEQNLGIKACKRMKIVSVDQLKNTNFLEESTNSRRNVFDFFKEGNEHHSDGEYMLILQIIQ